MYADLTGGAIVRGDTQLRAFTNTLAYSSTLKPRDTAQVSL
jgi:hypothetical protein